MSKPRAVFDTECTRDYWLIYFKDILTGRKKYFEMFDGHPLDRAGVLRIMRSHTLVGFNSLNYDVPMLKAALMHSITNDRLKRINDAIINGRMRYWEAEREFNLPKIDWLDHIDLIEPAPSVNVSLKLYGARLHSRRLQDMPFDPDELIFDGTPGKRESTILYCENDLDTTIDLYNHIEKPIDLRVAMSEQYGVDVRSKSDAQIAEAVIKSELERVSGCMITKPEYPSDYSFYYDAPDFLEFKTEQMQQVFDTVCNATFRLKRREVRSDEDGDDPSDGSGGVKIKVSGIEMPAEIKKLKIEIGQSVYKMGIGGLHSTEKRVSHVSDDEYVYIDADVGAFYPAIKLVCNLYPEHLGQDYIDIYRSIRERRMTAKKAKDKVTDMTLKIVLNGAFGKLGSKYSFLYSPKLMLQVTLTGQLALLMLIEALEEEEGMAVVSANTDGIVTSVDRNQVDDYKRIVHDWEKRTGFDMEFAVYSALYSASVNSYLAMKPTFDEERDLYRELFPHMDDDALRREFTGGVKQKGLYAFVGSKGSPAEKNPRNHVCVDAVIAYLTKGTPIEETIEWCPDVRRFLSVQRVKGGAEFEGEYLGKVARWYRSRNSTSCIRYANGDKKGDKVPKSDHAKPMMELSGFPEDIDYPYYEAEARKMLGELGVL